MLESGGVEKYGGEKGGDVGDPECSISYEMVKFVQTLIICFTLS